MAEQETEAQPIPLGSKVIVTIEGKVIGRTQGDSPPVLYWIEGDDGEKRWVPYYQVQKQ